MSEMVERVAQSAREAVVGAPENVTFGEMSVIVARAAIEAFNDVDDAFLHALSERMHDARFSRSGEDYPIARNFIRAFVDAALSEERG